MATSHSISGITANQLASFGNMQAYSRQLGVYAPGSQQFQQGAQVAAPAAQPTAGFGMMSNVGMMFEPSGPAFAPAGNFPGMNMMRGFGGMAAGVQQAVGGLIPGVGTMGLLGGAAGGMMGGVGGAVLGGGLGMAAGVPLQMLGNAITTPAMNTIGMMNQLQSNRFMMGTAAGGPMGGFSAGQVGQISQGVMNTGMNNLMTNVSETRDIMNQLSQMGVFQLSRDVPDILNKFGEMMKTIRDISVSAQTTFQGAIPIIQELRAIGIVDPGAMGPIVQQMAAGQRAGVSMNQQMAAGMDVANQALSMGLPGQQAFVGAARAAARFGIARQQGGVSEELFQRVGGAGGFARQVGMAAQQAAMGPMGIIAASAGLMPGQIAEMGLGNAIAMGAGTMGRPQDIISMLNQQDEAARVFQARPEMALGQMSMAMGMELPGDPTQNAQFMLRTRFGLTHAAARATIQQYQNRDAIALGEQINLVTTQEIERVGIRNREMFGDIAFRRITNNAMHKMGLDDVWANVTNRVTRIAGIPQRAIAAMGGVRAGVSSREGRQILASMISGTLDTSEIMDAMQKTGATQVNLFRPAGVRGAAGEMLLGLSRESPGGFFGALISPFTAPFKLAATGGGALLQAFAPGAGGLFAEDEVARELFGQDATSPEYVETLFDSLNTVNDFLSSSTDSDTRKAIQKSVDQYTDSVRNFRREKMKGSSLSAKDTLLAFRKYVGGHDKDFDPAAAMIALQQGSSLNVREMMKSMTADRVSLSQLMNTEDRALEEISKVVGAGQEAVIVRDLITDPEARAHLETYTRALEEGGFSGEAKDKLDAILLKRHGGKFTDAYQRDIAHLDEALNNLEEDKGKREAFLESLGTFGAARTTRQFMGAIRTFRAMITSSTRGEAGKLIEGTRPGQALENLRQAARRMEQTRSPEALEEFRAAQRNFIREAVFAEPEERAKLTQALSVGGLGGVGRAISAAAEQDLTLGERMSMVQGALEKSLSKSIDAKKGALRGFGGSSQDTYNARLAEYVRASTELLTLVAGGAKKGAIEPAARAATIAMNLIET